MDQIALSKGNAAKLLGVHPERFQALVDQGLISPLPYLGTYAVDDIRQLVESLRAQSKQENGTTNLPEAMASEEELGGSESGDPRGAAQKLLRENLRAS